MFLGQDDPEAAAKDDSTSVVTSETGRKRGEEEPQAGSGPSRMTTTLDSGDLHQKATADITFPAVV